jgi:hypothetical protein
MFFEKKEKEEILRFAQKDVYLPCLPEDFSPKELLFKK